MKFLIISFLLLLSIQQSFAVEYKKASKDAEAMCMLLAAKSVVPAIDGVKLKKIIVKEYVSKETKPSKFDIHIYEVTVLVSTLGKVATISKRCNSVNGTYTIK